MNRFVVTGLLAASASLALSSASLAAPAAVLSVRSTAATPAEQQDLNCLDAVTEQWSVAPSSAVAASPSRETLSALRAYYLGRLSAEVGDAQLVAYLRDPLRRKPVAWASENLKVCQARMERSNAALSPTEAKDFALEPAGAR